MSKFRSENSLNNSLVLVLTFALLILPQSGLASPFPAVGSSDLVSPRKGYMFHRKGFKLTKGQTDWGLERIETRNEGAELSTKDREIAIRFVSPISEGSLAVKTETITAPTSLEQYIKKWTKDYAYYGFDVLGARPFAQNNARGYVIDLFHSQQKKQVRQVIFLKDKTAVFLTCKDEKKQFANTLANCNSISKTFSWIN